MREAAGRRVKEETLDALRWRIDWMGCFLAAYDLRSMACHTKIRVLAIALALRKIRRAKSRYLVRREFQTLEGILSFDRARPFDRAWPLLFGRGIDSCQRLRHTKLSARQANLSSAVHLDRNDTN